MTTKKWKLLFYFQNSSVKASSIDDDNEDNKMKSVNREMKSTHKNLILKCSSPHGFSVNVGRKDVGIGVSDESLLSHRENQQ